MLDSSLVVSVEIVWICINPQKEIMFLIVFLAFDMLRKTQCVNAGGISFITSTKSFGRHFKRCINQTGLVLRICSIS